MTPSGLSEVGYIAFSEAVKEASMEAHGASMEASFTASEKAMYPTSERPDGVTTCILESQLTAIK